MNRALYCSLILVMITALLIVPPLRTEAQDIVTSLVDLDFEGANDPATVLNNPNTGLLTIGAGDFATDGKTNAAGAAASGTYATIGAFDIATVAGVNVSPKTAQATAAKTKLNTLQPGDYDIKLSFDYDIESRNITASPYIHLRLFGKNAVTGASGTSFQLVAQYVNNSTSAPVGDDQFVRFTSTVPIRIFAVADSGNEDSNGKTDEFVAGGFSDFDLRIANYSNPGTGHPSVLDFDNIQVEAILTSEPLPADEAAYIGENRTTQGNWISLYGSDGYVLPYYSSALSYGRDNPLAADVASLPSYVSSYSKYGSNYWVQENPSLDARALRDPAYPLDNTKRKKQIVYSGTAFEQTFMLNDHDKHLFTIYTTDYGNVDSVTEKFELFDLQNNLLESRTVNTIQNGVYLTFEVRGSFKIKATTLAGAAANIQGYFFDEMLENSLSDVRVTYSTPRSAQIVWDNANTVQDILIERKKSGETGFTQVQLVDGSETGYTDTGLDSGSTYIYRLRSASDRKYSEPTEEHSAATPAYNGVDLRFTSVSYSVYGPGEAVELEAELKDLSDNPLEGRTVSFELSGPHVGVQIPQAIGTAVTDVNGIASLIYHPPYSGSFEVVAKVPYDDTLLYSKGEVSVPLIVHNEPWESPPVIVNLSDAVKPGALFSIRGYGMNGTDMDDIRVMAKASTGSVPPGLPPVDAIELETEQKDAQSGYFVTARLDDALDPGVYDVWVGNEYGWSTPAKLNAPRPLFQSETEAYAGLEIELSGRNFASAEFGASQPTLVRLLSVTSATYTQTVTRLSPYALNFAIGNSTPTGDYDVEVSNDNGSSWAALGNGQKLSVVAAGDDPLGLHTSWASEFHWERQYDVDDYGAIADDGLDDSTAIQAAVLAAKTAGGGVVYFPAGAYHAAYINLPADVVLLGEDENTTELYHTGGSANFIRSSGDGKTAGRQGVARLTLKLDDSHKRPDSFIWLGNDWGAAVTDYTQRTASKLFIQNVRVNYPMEKEPTGTGRGMGFTMIADSRVVVANNDFYGYHAASEASYVTSYTAYRNNRFEFATGFVSIYATYSFVEGNHLINHPEFGEDSHGLFGRSNIHMEANIVENMGATSNVKNDGEALAVEMPGGSFDEGAVIGATADSVTFVPHAPLQSAYPLRSSYLAVAVTDGKGMGQVRPVTGVNGYTLELGADWDIVPDSTSKLTLITPNDNVTFYRNKSINNAKGIWFYGNAVDGVAADNVSTDSEGILIYTSQVSSQARLTPGYYIRATGNVITGVSRRSQHAGIAVHAQRNGVSGQYYAVNAFGIEIQDNRIEGVPSAVPVLNTEAPGESGIVSWAAQISSDANPSTRAGDITNIIIRNNRLLQLNKGISLSLGNYGPILSGNVFTDVTLSVEHKGSPVGEIELLNAFTDNRAPFWTGESVATSSGSGTTRELNWDAAVDNVGVDAYDIYQNGVLVDQVAGNVESWEADGLTAGQTNEYTIVAVDETGNRSMEGLRLSISVPLP